MSSMERLLVFALSDLQCALPLSEIERVVYSVEINPVPRTPEIVMGLIKVRDRVIPVLNIRKLFRLVETEISLSDQIIIGEAAGLPVAMVVDRVIGIFEYSDSDITDPAQLYPDIQFLKGVAKLKDGVIYIYSLDRFLSSETVAEITPFLTADTFSPDEPGR